MKRFLMFSALIAMLGQASSADAEQRYGWAVSASQTTPCETEGTFAQGGVVVLHLWYAYGIPDGLSAAEISVVMDPPGALNILGFSTSNGFLNAGTSTNLLLAVGGCPGGSLIAGGWLVLTNTHGWDFCLGGVNMSVDCQAGVPAAYPNDHRGFTNNNPIPTSCCVGFAAVLCGEACGPTPVESGSWGSIKGMYR